MQRISRAGLNLALGVFVTTTCLAQGGGPLIPRELLFGNPERISPTVSPDGKFLAYLAPLDGVMNVWVGPLAEPASAKAVTKDTKRGIAQYSWAFTSQHILYRQDQGGDENWHIYATDVGSLDTRDLTPFEKIAARIVNVSSRFPDEVLVAVNNRVPQLHDVHRVNLRTGESKLIQQNEGFAAFVPDDEFNIRMAMRVTPDGGQEILKTDGKGGWSDFAKIAPDDVMTTSPLGFERSGKTLYFADSRGRNTGALIAVDIESGKQTLLAENAKADVGAILAHPVEQTAQAVSFNFLRNEWLILDKSIAPDFDYLKTVTDGEFNVSSRTQDDKTWIVAYSADNGPARYYRYDRAAKKAEFLFTARPKLEGQPLTRMHPVLIKSRDGKELVSYLSLPRSADAAGKGRPATPLPMVLLVHGGPWARDNWGYNGQHQWLADRGYAVLSVNYRGSTGFGKEFINAANHEWAGKMHDDLLDAVNWAVAEKVADARKVAIMGGSYGGYATLVGLTFTPDVFACGVDIVGPSNLITLLNSIPEYWKPQIDTMTRRIGDHRTEEGRKLLESRSPLGRANEIRRPLLIGQGANDPRVKQAEADQIVQAMKDKRIPVTYVLYPDEGHGFQRPENRMSFNAVVEAFLATHLGGRAEPIGDDFKGASIQVPSGKEFVPGLKDALPNGHE
jgi:dipeptidyl aminopeptidase/acylaminoacyl peptidase